MTGPALAGDRAAAAALALVGVPFRLHGRDPAIGLDCVGVVEIALAAAGCPVAFGTAYALRNRSIAPLLAAARAIPAAPPGGPHAPGDILLVRPGPAQHHLLVATGHGGLVHAHAGLGRVVHLPATPPPTSPAPLLARPPWPVEAAWRPAFF